MYHTKLNSSIAELSDFVLTYRINEHRINTHYDLTSQLPTVYLTERLTDLVISIIKLKSQIGFFICLSRS